MISHFSTKYDKMKTTMKFMVLTVMATLASAASAQVVSNPTQELQQGVVSSVVTSNTDPQNKATLTNVQLSEQYKLQINVVNNEIKTLKSQAKLYKADAVKAAEVASQLAAKKAELADLKAKKRIADKAVKTEKASKKAAEKALKAEKKAADAAEKAAMLQKK